MRVGSGAVPGYPRPSRVAAVPLRDSRAVARRSPSTAGRRRTRHRDRRHPRQQRGPARATCTRRCPARSRHGAEFVAGGARRRRGRGADRPGRGAPRRPRPALPALVVGRRRGPCSATSPRRSTATRPPELTVIGITGTAGKTSTAYLVESGLRAAGHTSPRMIGTVETRLADLVIDSVRTTPEATDLHALFAAARGAGRRPRR